jgi:hypothetical protein
MIENVKILLKTHAVLSRCRDTLNPALRQKKTGCRYQAAGNTNHHRIQ